MSGAAAVAQRVDCAELAAHLLRTQRAARRVVAIAGAPGAGKSTFVERLCARIDDDAPGLASIVAMDGFHYDDRVLGAPHTFDVDGLATLLARLRADDGRDIAVPVFDRSLEIARAGADVVPASARLILVEGNYLLLGDAPWDVLHASFDVTVMLDVPRATLVERLTARWRGYGMDDTALRAKLDGNDLVNIDTVLSRSVRADFSVDNG